MPSCSDQTYNISFIRRKLVVAVPRGEVRFNGEILTGERERRGSDSV